MNKIWNPGQSDRVDAAQDWGLGDHGTTDLELALSQTKRIATVPALCTDPSVWCHVPSVRPHDLAKFDLVLITDAEYFDPVRISDWCDSLEIKNYRVATSGHWSDQSVNDRFIYRPYYVRPFLEKNLVDLEFPLKRPYLFDALLGARRPHRDYVMMALDQTGLLQRSIVTYRDCFPGAVIDQRSQEFQEIFTDIPLRWPYVSPHLDPDWEVSANINNQVSFITPWKIYQRTWYSIVCETLGTGSGFFLSEKTIKAMFARRIFVAFAPCGYLAWLRRQGFSTFGSIIDESYDQEPRDAFRYRKAMAQIMQLAWFERPENMYHWAKNTLDHNHKRLFELEEIRTRELAAAAQID